jgi:hypothetical protein
VSLFQQVCDDGAGSLILFAAFTVGWLGAHVVIEFFARRKREARR